MERTMVLITPWYGDSVRLVANYIEAVRHSATKIVAVDNGVTPETREALEAAQVTIIGDGSINHGFAGGNSVGYAAISSSLEDRDVVCFVNSDVTGGNGWIDVALHDVQQNGLYGPSMQYQLVYGRWLAYLEGWCIAGTKATWEQLGGQHAWAADRYPQPYWEDNALCFRAMTEHDIQLFHAQWPLRHIGGQTAGALTRWADAFEANRATFVGEVKRYFTSVPQYTPLMLDYFARANTESDINFHLPYLFSIAKGNVVELGTRSGNSTAAFLAGVELRGGTVTSVDIDDCSANFTTDLWRFIHGSSLDESVARQVTEPIDVLFIDTDHHYLQCINELTLWYPLVREGGFIVGHDPETFPGVRSAFEDFAARVDEEVTFVLPNNGLAILQKKVRNASDH